MAYTKNTWADGDIVTSEKLNHMEDGIASGESAMVINATDDTLDKTWQEIYDAMAQGKLCVVRKDNNTFGNQIMVYLVNLVSSGSRYTVGVGTEMYSASSATEYPMASVS